MRKSRILQLCKRSKVGSGMNRSSRARKSIEKKQLRRLKRIVRKAYKKSVFYRELFDSAGFHPKMLRTLHDLNLIPIIDRTDLRNAMERDPRSVYTRRLRNWYWRQTTSGSTGVPITIVATKAERARILLGILRAYRMAGMKLWHKSVVIKDPVDIRKKSLLEHFGVLRHQYFSIYSPIEEIISAILKIKKIDVLKSMPSDLANLVYSADTQNIALPIPRMVFSDSETLDASTRKVVEQYFGRAITDFYANTETGIAAFQTPDSNGRYLVPEDLVVFEAIRNPTLVDGDFEIILTGLINQTTPIIRYRIGDIVEGMPTVSEKRHKFSSVKSIHGKYLDFLVRPDGRIVSSHAAKQNLTHLPGIKQFQVVQTRKGHVQILIVKAEDWTDETSRKIMSDFYRDLGPDCEIELDFVENLSKNHLQFKKFKVVQSSVAQTLIATATPLRTK